MSFEGPVPVPRQRSRQERPALSDHGAPRSVPLSFTPADGPAARATELVGALLPGLDGSSWSDLALPVPSRVRLVSRPGTVHAAHALVGAFRGICHLPTDLVPDTEGHGDRSGSTLTLVLQEDGRVTTRGGAALWSGASATSSFGRYLTTVLSGSALAVALAAHTRTAPEEHWSAVRALAELPGRLDEAHRMAAVRARPLAQELLEEPALVFLSQGEGLAHAAQAASQLREQTGRWTEVRSTSHLEEDVADLVRHGTPLVVVDAGDVARLEAPLAEVARHGVRVVRIGRGLAADFPVGSSTSPPWGPVEAIVPVDHLARHLVHVARPVAPLCHQPG